MPAKRRERPESAHFQLAGSNPGREEIAARMLALLAHCGAPEKPPIRDCNSSGGGPAFDPSQGRAGT